MKRIYHILLVCIVLISCKKEDVLTYNSPDNIYLNFKSTDTAALIYSFAYNPGVAQDTVWLPVMVSGPRVHNERKFVISVVDDSTTAIKTMHYEPLKDFYVLPADSGKVNIPIILKNTDLDLENKTVALALTLKASSDFSTELPYKIRSKTILISNRLEKPSWWIYWQSQLRDYSRVKHQLFLITSGTKDLSHPSEYMQTPRSLYYIDNTQRFFADPFSWVAQHPEKGYTLTLRTDGTKDYDFYNLNAPDKKFRLQYVTQTGAYFFLDENGNQIVM